MEEEIKTNVTKPDCYISKLVFNNGQILEIERNAIVLFVGPNNTGKSQALKDIYRKNNEKIPSIVIKDLQFEIEKANLLEYIKTSSKEEINSIYRYYQGFNYSIPDGLLSNQIDAHLPEQLRGFFVAYLDTMNRLSICEPPQTITRDDIPQHPIHYAVINKKAKEWLSANFFRAFGEPVTPNILFGASIPLCIGPRVQTDPGLSDMEDQIDAYAEQLSTYKQVQNQGDGIKSFTGILLYMMIERYSTFLIDEPESFLHPPQARIMGEIIAETLTQQQQAFISTHSEEIVKGLLVKAPERVKVIRITRDDDQNFFSILQNEELERLWKDPLLRHSNILSSLFHKKVLLCESDSDCQMYSLIEEYLEEQEDRYSETLYIHCGGKQRISVVARALRSIGIDVRAIVDLDVMNDRTILKGIIEAFGGDWKNFEKNYHILDSQLPIPRDRINRESLRIEINNILDTNTDNNINENEQKLIREAIKTTPKWEVLKTFGIAGAPSGDATSALNNLIKDLNILGVFPVLVGELEKFVKEVGEHGPSWVENVLKQHPDFSEPIYNEIRDFIGDVINYNRNA